MLMATGPRAYWAAKTGGGDCVFMADKKGTIDATLAYQQAESALSETSSRSTRAHTIYAGKEIITGVRPLDRFIRITGTRNSRVNS